MAIYIHDEAARLRLRVTGDLDEQAARELASCWNTASSVVGSRRIVLDLTGLVSAHAAARELLGDLREHGAEFMTQSAFQSELVAEITGAEIAQRPRERGVGRWLKGVLGTAAGA